jgi:DNA/RNA-binding domain of Phe-tRNA-synthetase-like protein
MHFELDHDSLRLGLVYAGDARVAPSPPALLEALAAEERALAADRSRFPEGVRSCIRDALRKAGYKPTGRGKPASEYLLGLALEAAVPRLNNLVDINNLCSLRYALPISVLDADLLGPDLAVRFGRPGEAYVFNPSGQSLDLAGLPVICRGEAREPVGSPVKDAMACKISPSTVHALFVVYGSTELPEQHLERCMLELSDLLRRHQAAERLVGVFVPR